MKNRAKRPVFLSDYLTFAGLIQRVTYSFLASLLSVLLLFGTTSKEFVHLFADHQDTQHSHHFHDDGMQVGPEHHHCSFLSFTLAPFANDIAIPLIRAVVPVYYLAGYTVFQEELIQRLIVNLSLRGPPHYNVSLSV